MNKKVSIALITSIKENKRFLFEIFCTLAGAIVSIYLSIFISNYFYLLAVLLLYITLYLVKELIIDEYRSLIKKEKYFIDGRHLEYFENKKKQAKFELHIINGKRDGAFIEYYLDGQVKVNANYNVGEFNGPHKTYYENGNLQLSTKYINGKRDGAFIEYYLDGQVKVNANYNIGEFDGPHKTYYENGNIFRSVNLINGEYDGVVKEYFKNGNLKFLKENNKYTFYDEDNNLKCETHIKGSYGFLGIWKNYREDGTIEYELDFDDPNSDEKNNIVSKTIFTKGGDFFSKNNVSYEIISGSKMLYSSIDSDYRRENGIFNQPRTYKGPPGPCGSFTIDLKPIKSIEDIIKFI